MILINKMFQRVTLFIICITFLISGMFTGCTKTSNPGSGGGVAATLSLLKGNNQQGIYGEILNDTFVLKVLCSDSAARFVIGYKMIQGNGMIPNTYGGYLSTFTMDGLIRFNWRLGCNNPVQKLELYLYAVDKYNNPATNASDSIMVTATGTAPSGWGRSCGCEIQDIFSFKIFTHDNSRLYMVNGGLFYSDDKGINWYKVEGVPNWNDINDAQFNSKGWLYIVTMNNGIYYTKDMITWQAINTGILDYRTPTAFTVEDNTLFVSFYFDGPYMTTNNGDFWRKMPVGFGSQRYYFIRRYPNGSIYMFNDWSDLLISSDNGTSWQKTNVNSQYINYDVYDFGISSDGNLYIGSGDATIAALSPQTYTGPVQSYYQWNANSQLIRNIQFFNNDVYYLVCYTPNPGIYTRNNNWSILNLGFTQNIDYYYIKNDGKFLLASNGLYYKN